MSVGKGSAVEKQSQLKKLLEDLEGPKNQYLSAAEVEGRLGN